MAIWRQYENPYLFITFICNAKWSEILKALNSIPGQRVENISDIVVRVFKIKLDYMLKYIKSGVIFGAIIAGK